MSHKDGQESETGRPAVHKGLAVSAEALLSSLLLCAALSTGALDTGLGLEEHTLGAGVLLRRAE